VADAMVADTDNECVLLSNALKAHYFRLG
jgi:hypothetical protein